MDSQQANATRVRKLKFLGIMIGIMIAIPFWRGNGDSFKDTLWSLRYFLKTVCGQDPDNASAARRSNCLSW